VVVLRFLMVGEVGFGFGARDIRIQKREMEQGVGQLFVRNYSDLTRPELNLYVILKSGQ
jgi:hypothetical protein